MTRSLDAILAEQREREATELDEAEELSEDADHEEVEPRSSAAIAGWIFAVLIPVVGFFIGIALIASRDRDGTWITVVSVIMGIVWAVIWAIAVST